MMPPTLAILGPLLNGPRADWARNVLASGKRRGGGIHVVEAFPLSDRIYQRVLAIDEFLPSGCR